jgi:hypothetical protein
MWFDEDESTTNRISRTDGSTMICFTRKSLPIRVERITDATVPIGTNLDLLQVSCEDEGKFSKLLNDDANNKQRISTNISQIWTMEYSNHISMS